MSAAKFYLSLLAAAFFLAIQFPCIATTTNAASGSFTDVSNAVAKIGAGGVVFLPAGTNIWTNQLILKGVSLIGAGSNLTVIVDELSRTPNNLPVIVITNTTSQLTEVSQLQIRAGGTNTQINYYGEISAYGDSPGSWRIDHVLFNGPYGKAISSTGNPYAVVDHCLFLMREQGVACFGRAYGDTNWATPPNYGGSNMVYVENCTFTNIINSPQGVMDGFIGARVVFRHNVILNEYASNHGTESGQRYRSMRSFEIYDNSFADTNKFTWAIQLRGGTGVIFSNTATGYYNLCGMFYYRAAESFFPWGGMTGYNPWDTNDGVLYLTGIQSGTNGPHLVVTNVNWKVSQWVGYTVNDTNSGQFSIITSNTANTIMVLSSKDFGPMTFTNGHHFAIYRCQYGIDQIGRGSGDLLQGYSPVTNEAVGGTNWPRQLSEPLYFWGNTLNGTNVGGESNYPNIRPGRDYTNNAVKPGYTPYAYPHPLTLVTYTNVTSSGGTTNVSGGTTNVSGGTTNAGTTNPAGTNLQPPSNLHIIP